MDDEERTMAIRKYNSYNNHECFAFINDRLGLT